MKKTLIYFISSSLLCGCVVNKLNKNNGYSLMKPIENIYFQVRANSKSDSLLFYFYDSLKQKIDTGLIKGTLFVKYKNKENLICQLFPLDGYTQFSIVPEWVKYDICELVLFYSGTVKKIKFYNEREDWNKKTPLIAPWRGMF